MIPPEFCAYNRHGIRLSRNPFSGKRRFMKLLLYIFPLLALWFSSPTLADDGKQAKRDVFQVPYRLTATQHVLVRAKINGKGPYNFILDTGAPALFVSTAVGKKLDLTADKNGWTSLDRCGLEGGAAV